MECSCFLLDGICIKKGRVLSFGVIRYSFRAKMKWFRRCFSVQNTYNEVCPSGTDFI